MCHLLFLGKVVGIINRKDLIMSSIENTVCFDGKCLVLNGEPYLLEKVTYRKFSLCETREAFAKAVEQLALDSIHSDNQLGDGSNTVFSHYFKRKEC